MLKSFFKLICLICLLFINTEMVFASGLGISNSYNLTIQMGNLSLKTNLPQHDFAYEMTIPDPDKVTYTGAPLQGTLSFSHMDITTVFTRYDDYSLDVNLKITDPALGNRIIWKGKVTYDRAYDKVESIPEIVDNLHYGIYINLIQPKQGRPQFIIGIVSI